MPVDNDFWLQRWQDANTPWHKAQANTLLESHFGALALETGAQVLVPLCGKTADLTWLSQRGYRVLGVELSAIACEAFFTENGFAENKLHASTTEEGAFQVFEAESVCLLAGDIFALEPRHVTDVAAVYDRAALIALPADLRAAYVEHLAAILPARARWLLVSLEYPPNDISGPPFAVYEEELKRLFAGHKRVQLLESRDILENESGLRARGITALSEHVYKLD